MDANFVDVAFLVGRIIFGGFFVLNGLNHYLKSEMLSGYAVSKGVPSPKLAVLGSGALILLGGLGVILGVYVQWSLVFIAVFLLGVTFKMHAYWKVTDPMARMAEQVNFLKNLALLGAALMMLSIHEPWPFSVGF